MKLLPANQVVQVIILLSEPAEREDEEAWARLSSEQFLWSIVCEALHSLIHDYE
jgi:hypothetical protein